MELSFVHRFVPASDPNSKITLLALHGTGGDESDLVPLAQTLAPGAAILSPRGKVLENGMPRFFRRLREGVFDEKDVIFRASELAEFVTAAAAKYHFDPAGVVAVSYSNGANTAAAILLLRPQTLAGAIRTALLTRTGFDLQAFAKARRTCTQVGKPAQDALKQALSEGQADTRIVTARFRGPWPAVPRPA